ncbi:MAG: hypothetical protein QM780_11175 [Hyphomicrobium sp.]
MKNPDGFQHSMMAEAAHRRLLGAAVILVVLWIAIGWAVSLP